MYRAICCNKYHCVGGPTDLADAIGLAEGHMASGSCGTYASIVVDADGKSAWDVEGFTARTSNELTRDAATATGIYDRE